MNRDILGCIELDLMKAIKKHLSAIKLIDD